MPTVDTPLSSLLNGVSQQAASLRHPTQCEEMINFLPDLAKGLIKRPPFRHIAEIMATAPSENLFVHWVNRGPGAQYFLVIENGDLNVYGTDGSAEALAFPDGKAYLTATNPRAAFKAVTVADYTFILNTEKTVTMRAATNGDTLTGTVQTFSDLPASPSTGNVYKIQGDESSDFTTYYVKYDGSVWVETIEPGEKLGFDTTTMPHVLIPGVTWSFEEGGWTDRVVGDDVSAPEPSFVDKTIRDIFFWRNRLGFLADEYLILSRVGTAPDGYFSFWPETVQQVLDSDPIDKGSPHEELSLFDHAVPFDEELLILSAEAQFIVSTGGQPASPQSVDIDVVTQFTTETAARPVVAGRNMYYIADHGDYAGMREFFVDADTDTEDAADVTAHVPRFIPAGVFQLGANSNEDLIVALTSGDPNRIYHYKYFWDEDRKAQSAWGYWELADGDDIQFIKMVGSTMWVVVKRSDGVFLEKATFKSDESISDLGFEVHLDRRQQLTGVYSSGTGLTTWTLPYTDTDAYNVVLGAAFTGNKGRSLATSRPTSTTITAAGDWSASTAWVGKPYTARYRFSEQFYRSGREKQVARVDGRLQLYWMLVRYATSGYFRAEVVVGGTTYTYPFTGRVLGASVTLGSPSIATGSFRIPIMSSASEVTIDLINDSYLPSVFLSARWRGLFTPATVIPV